MISSKLPIKFPRLLNFEKLSKCSYGAARHAAGIGEPSMQTAYGYLENLQRKSLLMDGNSQCLDFLEFFMSGTGTNDTDIAYYTVVSLCHSQALGWIQHFGSIDIPDEASPLQSKTKAAHDVPPAVSRLHYHGNSFPW